MKPKRWDLLVIGTLLMIFSVLFCIKGDFTLAVIDVILGTANLFRFWREGKK